MGRPQSQETRDKISASLKLQHAAGTRPKVVPNKSGNGMRGKHHSPETIAKMSASQKDRPLTEAHKQALRKPSPKKAAVRRGIPRSPETIAKMSAGSKAHWSSLSDEERGALNEKRLRSVRYKDTNLEAYVARQLTRDGILYEQQKRVGRYVVDFLVPTQNRIIEVNGCFWHGCEQCGYNAPEALVRREHDGKRIVFLESKGYTVTVLWQHDLLPLMKSELQE